MQDRLDLDQVAFIRESPDFLTVIYNKDVTDIDRGLSELLVDTRIAFQGKDTVCQLLMIVPGTIRIAKDAREYLSNGKGIQGLSAIAIVIERNPVTMILAEFILRVQRPAIRIRVFRDEQKARKWLSKIQERNGLSIQRQTNKQTH